MPGLSEHNKVSPAWGMDTSPINDQERHCCNPRIKTPGVCI